MWPHAVIQHRVDAVSMNDAKVRRSQRVDRQRGGGVDGLAARRAHQREDVNDVGQLVAIGVHNGGEPNRHGNWKEDSTRNYRSAKA